MYWQWNQYALFNHSTGTTEEKVLFKVATTNKVYSDSWLMKLYVLPGIVESQQNSEDANNYNFVGTSYL